MGQVLDALKAAGTIITTGASLVRDAVAAIKRAVFDKAAGKAKDEKDTTDLDQSLAE